MLHKLKYFIEIAEQRSFTSAARTFFVSQPALSKQMKRLEEELGFDLFNRSVKGVELSQKGKSLYEDLKPLFTQIDKTIGRYQRYDQIRFGSTPILSTYFLPSFYNSLTYSNVHIVAIKEDSQELVPLLLTQEIDAAIVQDVSSVDGLFSSFLFSENFVAAIPVSLALASKKEVTLAECFDYTQIIPPTGGLSEQVRALMQQHHFKGNVLETHYLGMGGLVSLGIGIAYLPKMMADAIEQRGVIFLPIKDAPLKREMYLYAQKSSVFEIL
ncbi:MAG: LysR family transcriptional regulator, partial [Anaerobacillus sp.]